MFEKLGEKAEKLAANVSESRRGFLSGLGKVALGAVGIVAGVLPATVQADHGPPPKSHCVYRCPDGREASYTTESCRSCSSTFSWEGMTCTYLRCFVRYYGG
jgi:hypothetical protein